MKDAKKKPDVLAGTTSSPAGWWTIGALSKLTNGGLHGYIRSKALVDSAGRTQAQGTRSNVLGELKHYPRRQEKRSRCTFVRAGVCVCIVCAFVCVCL